MINPRLPVLISICHNCEFSQTQRGGCKGHCPCHADGRDIAEHAKADYCPKGFYPDGVTANNLTMAAAIHGAVGLVKAAVGMDKSSPELIAQRQEICEACEHWVKPLGLFHRCDICKCATHLKIRLKGEKCPIGKW